MKELSERSRLWLIHGAVAVSVTVAGCAQQIPTPSFNSARAMQYTREVVGFGPRPIGSPNQQKLENYILARLKADTVEDDAFTPTTPEGKFPVRNLIANFPSKREGLIVIAGYYDTHYSLRNTGLVVANVGGVYSELF